MAILDPIRGLTSSQRHAFMASLAGWSLDAFDFFPLSLIPRSVASPSSAESGRSMIGNSFVALTARRGEVTGAGFRCVPALESI